MVDRRTTPSPVSVAGSFPPAIADQDPGRAPSEELERLQQRLGLIGQAARLGFWEYDFETEELWVSDELAGLYGMRSEEFTWPAFVSRLHPEDKVVPLERPTPSYPFGVTNDFFFRVRHAEGGYRYIRSRSVTYGENGVPTRKLGVHIDMSDDTLLRLAKLSDANERLRQFAYMASHDLRSPLRGIRALVGFVIEDHGDTLPDDVLERLDEVKERAARLDRLVVDMLEYASADWDKLDPSPVDVRAMIDDVLATVDRRQCRIEVDLDIGPGRQVRVAGRPLAGCIRNLVDNACKYNDKEAGIVRIGVALEDPWLRVEIADDGPGIPDAIRENLFSPLQTSDPSRGSGLGLAHVHKVVERHHGSVEVETSSGGTTFTLRWALGGIAPDA